jgi:hypothetical protein
MVLRALLCLWILGSLGCGSRPKNGALTGSEGEPQLIKKASLAWGIKPIGSSADVFFAVTDENGRATSHPLGRFEGECTIIGGGRPSTGAITAVLCKRGDIGVELDAVPRPGVVIVLKIPYVVGADPDPLSGEEIAHITVPIGAKIEISN